MKKAKQILSLMLVIAMALGMMVFVPGTASAKNVGDYPDADDIEYKEAVDVLSALGVLLGDDTGAFGPKNNITREQAAKIITYILIGTTAAERLAPRASSFTDVATDRWSNKYIEYCVEKGIIKGYGDGNFGPADPVTASQMAKMLLICIGYGAMGEYDNADSWELNTIVDGQKRGILTIDEDYTKPANREQVAQYTFNALTSSDAFLVSYSDLAKEYLPRGSSIFTAVSQTYLGAETFRLVADTRYNDELGYSGRIWRRDSVSNVVALTPFYRTDVTLARSTDGTPITDEIFGGLTDVGMFTFKARLERFYTYDIEGNPTTYGQIEYYINGKPAAGNDATSTASATAANTAAGKRGVIVELVDRNDDGLADKVIIVEKKAAVVLTNPSKDAFGSTTINGVTANSSSVFAAGKVDYPEDLKAGDVVLYYTDNPIGDGRGGVTHIQKAESISGTMTSYTPNSNGMVKYSTMNFGGSAMYPTGLLAYDSANNYTFPIAEPYNTFFDYARTSGFYGQPAVAYVDEGNGIIALSPGDETDLEYLVVAGTSTGTMRVEASVIFPDGTRSIITVSKYTNKDGDTFGSGFGSALATEAETNPIYAYTYDASGGYVLEYVTNVTIDDSRDIERKARFDGVNTGNASTIFIVTYGNTTKSFAGVANAPVYDAADRSSDGYAVYGSKGVVELVYFNEQPKKTDTNTLFFYSLDSFTWARPDGVWQYTYTVVDVDETNGTTMSVTLDSIAHGQLMSYRDGVDGDREETDDNGYTFALVSVTYDSNGIIVDADVIAPTAPIVVADDYIIGFGISKNPSGGLLNLGVSSATAACRYNNDTKIYLVDTTSFTPVVRADISQILASDTAVVFGKVVDEDSDMLEEVYVYKRSAATVVGGEGLAGGTDIADIMGSPAVEIKAKEGDKLSDVLSAVSVGLVMDNGKEAKGAIGDFNLSISGKKVESSHVISVADKTAAGWEFLGLYEGYVYVAIYENDMKTDADGMVSGTLIGFVSLDMTWTTPAE